MMPVYLALGLIVEYFLKYSNIKRINSFICGGIMILYERIKLICSEKGLSISNLEKAAGLSNGSIRKWNRLSPTVDNLIAVSRILGFTLDELLGEKNEIEFIEKNQ